MNHKQMWFFTILFLIIIYFVPAYQTAYELSNNKSHRIQMLDLLDDIFLFPLEKANADVQALNDLRATLDSLLADVKAADSAWNPSGAERFADEAAIKVRLLKKSVLDYNRHIKGGNNPYVTADTIKPYYQTLKRIQRGLAEALSAIQGGSAAEALPLVEAMVRDGGEAQSLMGGKKGAADYPGLVLTALRRNMVGASYLRPYEKEMQSVSVFSNVARPWTLFAYYAAFEDLGDKGILGEKNWFYYRPDVQYLTRPHPLHPWSRDVDPNDVPVTDAIIDSIAAFRDALEARGIGLIVVLMPAKPSIYPDLLNADVPPSASGTFSHTLQIIADLRKRGVDAVDLFSAFAAERKNDSLAGDSIFLHTDTHFKGRAVRVTAKVVADHIRKYPWYVEGTTEYAIDTVIIPRFGDVAEMTKLPAMTFRGLHLFFPPESVRCYQVYEIRRDASGAVIQDVYSYDEVERVLIEGRMPNTNKTLYRDDYKNSQVLVLGDSYSRIYQTDAPRSAGWISHLAFELKQPVASIVNDGGASTLVREQLVRKLGVLKGKKVVVWEIVERDLRYGDKGWRNLALKKPEEEEE